MSLVVEALKKAAALGQRSSGSGRVLQTAIVGGGGRSRGLRVVGGVTTLVAVTAAGVVLYQQLTTVSPSVAPAASQPVQEPARPVKAEAKPAAQPSGEAAAAPSRTDRLLADGVAQLRAQRLVEARQTFEQAVRLSPDSAEAHTALGLVLRHLRSYPEAESEYRTALRLNPDNAIAMNNLGLLSDLQGRTEDAISWYQKALGKRADYHEAHLNLAIALERRGRTSDAKTHYQAFLKSPPAELAEAARLGQQHLAAK